MRTNLGTFPSIVVASLRYERRHEIHSRRRHFIAQRDRKGARCARVTSGLTRHGARKSNELRFRRERERERERERYVKEVKLNGISPIRSLLLYACCTPVVRLLCTLCVEREKEREREKTAHACSRSVNAIYLDWRRRTETRVATTVAR